jgi:hypothetical protein
VSIFNNVPVYRETRLYALRKEDIYMKRQALYSYSFLVIVGLLFIELLAWGTPAAAADTPGTWKLTGSMVTARRHAASATLPDGRILVVGGTNTTGVDGTASVFYGSAEIYDPGPCTERPGCRTERS